jgi:uncharacterized protein (TIGR03437 family)
VYRGELTIRFNEDAVTRKVDLLLVVASGAPTSARSEIRAASADCTPTKLLPTFTELGRGFVEFAAWPSKVEVKVVDDCGAPMLSGTVTARFPTGDAPVQLTSLKDGRWTGSWASASANAASVKIRVLARITQPRLLEGTEEINGKLQANSNPPPAILSGGVVSAASFSPQVPSAPGAWLAIFGSKLADGSASPTDLPLPIQLQGAQVLMAGSRLPIVATSDGRIDALVPFDINPNITHQLAVRRGLQQSVPEPVTIAPAQPGVFTVLGTGKGQGRVYLSTATGDQVLADSKAPAKPGDSVIAFCAGLGAIDPPVPVGAAAVNSRVTSPISATIGGVNATVSSAIAAPGFAGLYIVSTVVPEGVAAGEAVPLVLTVAGQASPPVSLAVQ